MEIKIREGEEFIRLGQALKKAGVIGAGSDAKIIIQNGEVSVNGEIEQRRGRKLYSGDTISFEEESFLVVK